MQSHDPTAGIPDSVISALLSALDCLAGLQIQRDGMKRLGLGDRYDADLDAAGARSAETVREFVALAPGNGVDPGPALATLARTLRNRDGALAWLNRMQIPVTGGIDP